MEDFARHLPIVLALVLREFEDFTVSDFHLGIEWESSGHQTSSASTGRGGEQMDVGHRPERVSRCEQHVSPVPEPTPDTTRADGQDMEVGRTIEVVT